MDNNLTFNQSFQILKRNKYLSLPFIFSNFFFYFILISSIFLSFGFNFIDSFSYEYGLYNQYVLEEQARGNYLYNDFSVFLENKNSDLFSEDNFDFVKILKYFIFGFFIWYFINIFFINIGYYQNINTITKIGFKENFSKLISHSSEFFLKLFVLRIISLFIVFGPFLLFLGLSFLFILINPISSVILFLFTFFGGIFWLFYASMRLFFLEASLYSENGKGLTYDSSIGEVIGFTFKKSKGNLKKIFLIYLIVMGINSLAQSISINPLSNLFGQIFGLSLGFEFLLFFVMLLIIIISTIMGFVNCYTNLYLLNSYLQFRNDTQKEEVL